MFAFPRNLIKNFRRLQDPNQSLLFYVHRWEPLSRPRVQGELSLLDSHRSNDHGNLIHLLHVLEKILLRSTHRRNPSADNPRCIPGRGTRNRCLPRPLPRGSALQDWLWAQPRQARFQRIHKPWMAHGRCLARVLGRCYTLL